LRVVAVMHDHLTFSCAAIWGAAEGEDEGHENYDRRVDVICDTHSKDVGTGHEGAQGSEVRRTVEPFVILHSKEKMMDFTSGSGTAC
jgi:hypothetical protein